MAQVLIFSLLSGFKVEMRNIIVGTFLQQNFVSARGNIQGLKLVFKNNYLFIIDFFQLWYRKSILSTYKKFNK